MKSPVGYSVAITVAVKLLALSAFFLFLTIIPIDTRFSLYGKEDFVGRASTTLAPWIVNWANFDGFAYLTIARNGYTPSVVAFFPFYPLLIRSVTAILPKITPGVVIAQGISLVAFFGAVFLVLTLYALDHPVKRMGLLIASLILFPTSYSYTAVYNDSLFFLFTMLTLYGARKHAWLWASFAGALATLTRLNGLALFPYLLTEIWLSHRGKPLKYALAPALFSTLVPLAFLGYLLYIHGTFGSWHVLFTSMSVWGQDRMILPIQTLFRYAKILLSVNPLHIIYWVAVMELVSFLWYVYLLVWSWKRIRLPYWIFFFVSILIPALTGTFQGMPRYGLHLYPLFLATALWLSQKPTRIRLLYVCISVALYLFCVTLFTHGIFIA